MINNIHKSNGFSLIEITVAMGLMGAFVMGFLKLSDKIVDSEKRMMDLMEMNDVITRVRYIMNDAMACNNTFRVNRINDKYIFSKDILQIRDRKKRVVLETGKKIGRIMVSSMRASIDTIDDDHIMEEPLMSAIIVELKGRSKLTQRKIFKISIPLMLNPISKTETEFIGCDSIVGGVAAEMVNQTMMRMCKTLNVPYNDIEGTCDMSGGNAVGGQAGIIDPAMIQKIMEMMQK